MKIKEQSLIAIEEALKKALYKYSTTGEQTVITDIYIQVLPCSGDVNIYDDDELLSSTNVEEWAGSDDTLYNKVESSLRLMIEKMKRNGDMDNLAIIPPYSFALVDGKRETIVDLAFVDDDLSTIIISDELLSGLDDELNSFIVDLLDEE